MTKKYLLWIECLAIFGVVPVLLWLRLVSLPLILIPVYIGCILVTIWLARKYGFSRSVFWSGDIQAERKQLRIIAWRFVLVSVVLLAIVFIFFPDQLFDMPRRIPLFWLLIIAAYPIFSVYPQELLYRTYFFHRYRALVKNQQAFLIMNAILFGWTHLVFHNVVAVVFTLVGGWLFADTYNRTKSLRLTCLEHTLYGSLIFTFGYGRDFLFEPWFYRLMG